VFDIWDQLMNAVLISPCYASRLRVIVQTGEKYRLGRKRDVFLNEWFQHFLQNRGAFIFKGKEPKDFEMSRDTVSHPRRPGRCLLKC